MNKNKKRNDYIEMPLATFYRQCPDLAEELPPELRHLAVDDNYIIRIDAANCKLEIGYREDDWLIG